MIVRVSQLDDDGRLQPRQRFRLRLMSNGDGKLFKNIRSHKGFLCVLVDEGSFSSIIKLFYLFIKKK